jgi:transposase
MSANLIAARDIPMDFWYGQPQQELYKEDAMPRTGLRLTTDQEKELRDEFQRAKYDDDLDKCLRIQGLLLVNQGHTEQAAAAIIGAGRRTLQDWISRYRKDGIFGLIKGPYPGGKCALSEEQKAELSRIIEAGPQEAGLDTGVWSAPIVVKMVEKLYGVSYSPSHMGRILHSLKMSVQYPTRQYPKGDDKAQKQWREETLPEIRIKADKEKAAILYGDEASFQQSGTVHRSWAPVGKGFSVLTPPVRKSSKVIGAVQVGAAPKWHFQMVDWFNADSFTAFLDQLVQDYSGVKIHFITDNAKYHKCPKVWDWLKEKEKLIELHFIPPYSPKLNAAEYLWKKTKKATTHNRYFAKFPELVQALERQFKRFREDPASIRSTIPYFA